MHSVTASPQPTDTPVARQNPTPLREARPLTQQLWFLTKGGITSLYHTGHFTQVFTLLTQQMRFRTKRGITSLYHTGHFIQVTSAARSYTADSATVVPNDGWHYLIIPHRTLCPGYYTADSANVVPNEGWHYLIIPHRALYPGYISGKILHC